MEVLVLKTNIRFKKQVKAVAPILDSRQNIARWNIDLNDVDKVLRIESKDIQEKKDIQVKEVVQLIRAAGFHCEELAD